MMMKILNQILELFFPRLCICCDKRLLDNEPHICLLCLYSLPYTNHLKKGTNELEQLFAGKFIFNKAATFTFFIKGGKMQKIIHEIKYHNNPTLGKYFGTLIGEKIKNNFQDIDYIVPIPLHKKRLKSRGYNQSLIIAEGIVLALQKQICENNLIRKIDNPSQTKNSKDDRLLNTKNIFTIANKQLFQDKHILLVDDVITTGATIEACAKLILKECVNCRISIYALALTVN